MTMIHVSAIRQPKTNAAGQKSKTGTIQDDVAGKNYRIYEDKIPPFMGLEGQTVDVNIDETQEWVRNMGSHGLITGSPRGAGARPPVSTPTLPPRQSAPGGPVAAPMHYQQRVHPDEGRQMYVSNFVARAMQSGQWTDLKQVRELTQAALDSYWQQLNAVEPPKMPKPIKTTAGQWTSEPPPDEPGDPGAQLQ